MHILPFIVFFVSTYSIAEAADCEWRAWSSWSKCSKNCGKGETIRHRKCDRRKPCHGCYGTKTQRQRCPGAGIAEWSSWTSYEKCSTKCKPKLTVVRTCGWRKGCKGHGKAKCAGERRRRVKCKCCKCKKTSRCIENKKKQKKCQKCCKCLPAELCEPKKKKTLTPRLPTTLQPYHYNLELKPDLYINFSFSGIVHIYLRCSRSTDSIVIHSGLKHSAKDVHVYDSKADSELNVSEVSADDGTEQFTIKLDQPLKKGQYVLLKISFTGRILPNLIGLYWSSYKQDDKLKYMVSTQLQATYARKMFPCLDEPGFKATFNISIWRREPMIALSNMPLDTTETKSNGWLLDHFAQTPVPMSTYLVAVAVGELDTIHTMTNNGKMIGIVARREMISSGFASYPLQVAGPMLEFYQDYFDQEYDLPKSDQIAVPAHSAAAMENWGLVTYFEPLLMLDPKYASPFEIWRTTRVIAHELVHQWIGNTVTISWWGDLWIQEGLTCYFERRGIGHVQPSWDLSMMDHAQYIYLALDSDQSGDSHPLYKPALQNSHEIHQLFSVITYYKGYAMFVMIEQFVFRSAPKAFHNAIIAFVKENMYGSYGHETFLEVLQEHADSAGIDVNISAVLSTWITQVGCPVVKFKRSERGLQLHIEQKRFLINSDQPIVETYPAPYDHTWEVPISYYTKQDSRVQYNWLHRNNRTINLNTALGEDDWIVGNYRHAGFYRMNYDDALWSAIIKQLKKNHKAIDVLQRGQLLDDAFDLGRALETDHLHALKLSEYLTDERKYLPWCSFIESIEYTDSMLGPTVHYGHFKRYIQELSEQIFSELGWQSQDNLMDSLLQDKIIHVACTYGNIDCITRSLQLFQDWMENPTNVTIIDTNYRSSVYCTAVRNALSSKEWLFLFDHYKSLEHVLERWMVRDALACSQKRWILQMYFEMGATSNSSLDLTDHVSVMLAVAKNYPLGQSVALDYLNQHWEDMLSTKYLVLAEAISGYSTQSDLKKFDNFVRDHSTLSKSGKASYASMRSTINANIKWKMKNNNRIVNWLQEVVA